MQFPVNQVPFVGNGMTIGFNAVIHVLISHGVAIGAFGMLLLADWAQWAMFGPATEAWTRFRHRLLKFIVITATVLGAITGVGIWFTTTALAPRAIASMLRVFFWPWFIEWGVFVAEVLSLLAIYLAWDSLAQRRRLRITLLAAYLLFAIASAVLITGNLGFMLTAGDWPTTGAFWSAFVNPTFLPQLATRLSFGFAIGAIVAMLFVFTQSDDAPFRRDACRLFGLVLLLFSTTLALSLAAYVNAVPVGYRSSLQFSLLSSQLSQHTWILWLANGIGAAVVIALAAAAWLRRIRVVKWLLIPALLLMAGFTAQFERAREFIRGPYLMPGYMYVNGILMTERPAVTESGLLPRDEWYQLASPEDRPLAQGAHVFARNCAMCHTIGGLNDIRQRAEGRSEDGLYVIIGRTHGMISFMPPFSGNDAERHELARFIFQVTNTPVEFESYWRLIPAAANPAP